MKLIIIESLQDFGAINQNDLKFFPVVIAALHDLTNVLTKRTNATCYSIVTANAMKNVLLDIFFYRQPKMHISDEEKIKTIIDQI